MKILAIDSSGQVASAAIIQDGVIKAESLVNNKKTHSESLLPMVDSVLVSAGLQPTELDAVAIAKGPGSFTGLRIGSSTAKGICFAASIPLVEVSTLLGLAMNAAPSESLIVPIMDARRSEVYTTAVKINTLTYPYSIEEVIPEAAMNIDDLCAKLNAIGEKVVFVGDGVPPYLNKMAGMLEVQHICVTPANLYQRASSIAILGEQFAEMGRTIPAAEHKPVYLRDMAQGVKYEG